MLRCAVVMFCLLACLVMSVQADDLHTQIVALRRLEPNGAAALTLLDADGQPCNTSSTTWNYHAPYIQSTVDINQRQLWVVTYPDQQSLSALSGALVMKFDLNVKLLQSYKPSIGLFDFQYSSKQNCIFGIAVASRFGRMFSRFDVSGDSIVNTSIQLLPDMFFINASTYNQDDDVYFGLLNYFPGQANYTSVQQLLVGDMSDTGSVSFAYLTPAEGQPAMSFRFISYSHHSGQLLGFGSLNPTRLAIASINPVTAQYEVLIPLLPGYIGVAPLLTRAVASPGPGHDKFSEACVFVCLDDGNTCLECFNLDSPSPSVTLRTCYSTADFGGVWQANVL